jgi:alpha-1,2-glucosyltransferase
MASAAVRPCPQDEPFHVPQTQRYCEGRWGEWDPKITTFPGLYLFGTAAARAVGAAQRLLPSLVPGAVQPCGTTVLRGVSLAFAAACLPLFHHAARQLDGGRTEVQAALMVSWQQLGRDSGSSQAGTGILLLSNLSTLPPALIPTYASRLPCPAFSPRLPRSLPALQAAACFLFPLHFFFSFLYYTDVPSLFFTLAAYLAAHARRTYAAAVLGAAAVGLRQTNAVWVAFCLGTAALQRCSAEGGGARKPRSSDGGGQGGRPERDGCRPASGSSSGGSSGTDNGRGGSEGSPPELLEDLSILLPRAWRLRRQLLSELWPLAAVVAAFAAFVAVNGGVVVGDRQHHAPVRHLAQPLYCLLYCTAWLAPVFWTPAALRDAARRLAAAARRRPAAVAARGGGAVAVAAAAVSRGTLAHPFLLADNRHYTFYLYRRVLNRTPWARYAFVPLYLYSGWALYRRLAHRSPLWLAGLAAATCLVLVPAHLIEPRYFTTPFFLVFLHMRTPRPRQLAGIVALFAAADAATLYLFLARPFAWPDGSVARFMW